MKRENMAVTEEKAFLVRFAEAALSAFYTVRSERQLMEQLDSNLWFRWFVGLSADDPVWDATVFCKNRDRQLDGGIARKFMTSVLNSVAVMPIWPALIRSTSPPSRTSALVREAAASLSPRYAKHDLKRPSRSSTHSKRSACSSSQVSLADRQSPLLQKDEVLRRVSSCSLRLELDELEALGEDLAQVPLGVVGAAEIRADELAPTHDELAGIEACPLVRIELRDI